MSNLKIPFKTALGISTGCIIRTSYSTGPYEVVDIHGPNDRNGVQIISLDLVRLGETPHLNRDHLYWINAVRREEDRWFSGHDEIFVTTGVREQQMSFWTSAASISAS